MNDKVEEVFALSDEGDAGDCDGTVSPTPVTVPKKRGRPANAEKPKKVPSGRGRGRPSKVADGANKKPSKAAVSADGSDEEGSASDGGSPLPNGDAEDVSPGRGRQPKGKRKLTHTIEATGKGRGRPKKTKVDVVEDDVEGGDDNEDGASSDYKPGKKATSKTAKKGRGRPKRVQNSDDESSDDKMEDDEERRTVGRPPSGGVNLNIVRTGRGQGRPKKEVAARRAADAENGGGDVSKKRGRPTTSGKVYVPTGKPRGRPKMAVQEEKDSQEDDEEDADENPSEKAEENSAEDVEEDEKNKSESDDGI